MRTIGSMFLGFIVGAIATLTIHEAVKWLFIDAGVLEGRAWDVDAVDYGVLSGQIPKVASAAFWGGVWGAVMALLFGSRPEGSMTLKGAVFGMFFPALLGVFVAVPLIKGQPPFMGGDPAKCGAVLAILAAWGVATAWFYGLFSYGRLP